MNPETVDLLEATANADAEWLEGANYAIDHLRRLGAFTADDLVRIIGLPVVPNRVGAVLNGAARAGRIRAVGWRESSRKSRHSGVQRIWAAA